jgi:small-conductance mechanosensitive channel
MEGSRASMLMRHEQARRLHVRDGGMRMALVLACAAVQFLLSGVIFAQEALLQTGAAKPATPGQTAAPGQPVVLDGKTLFSLDTIQGYSAQERARTIAGRIKAIADNPRIDTASIRASGYARPMTLISAGSELIMVVFEEDALARGRSQQELSTQWARELKSSIDKYRSGHSVKWILAGAVKAFAATVVLIIALLVLGRAFLKADTLLKEWIRRKPISIRIQSFELMKGERIGVFLSSVLRAVRLVLVLVLIYAYIHVVMRSFPWTSAYADQLFEFVVRPFGVIGMAVWAQIPNLFFVAIIFLLGRYLLNLLKFFFFEVEKGNIALQNFHPEWAEPTYKICRILIVIIVLIMAFPYIPGSDSPAFKGISIFLGVLFSLGSSTTVSNILAGYSLIYRRAFKVGDRVKIADFMGDVTEMRLEVTHLRTIKNEEIVVPNAMIVNSHVVNYSSLVRQGGLILHTGVTIGYDAPWRQIHALLLLAAEKTPGLLREPKPFILQTSLDDFYASYELNVYCDTPLKMVELYSELHKNIQDAFNEYGVQIMSPNYRFDPARPKIVPKDQWYAAPAAPPDMEPQKGDL